MGTGTVDLVWEERTATLIINRPEKRNALSPEILKRLHDALTELAEEDKVRAVVLRGAGETAFSAGFDLGAIPSGMDGKKDLWSEGINPLEKALQSVIHFPYPVIAFVNGFAFGGGCELALCCDLRIGAEGIQMGMPPARLGLVYSPIGLARFLRTLGPGATKELFFTGRYISAERAKELGLLDYLLPRQEAEAFVREMASAIAENAPLALKGIKRIINMLTAAPLLSAEELREADRLVAASLRSEDFQEARRAFQEKRKPEFKGR